MGWVPWVGRGWQWVEAARSGLDGISWLWVAGMDGQDDWAVERVWVVGVGAGRRILGLALRGLAGGGSRQVRRGGRGGCLAVGAAWSGLEVVGAGGCWVMVVSG